jgi:hypothetical protein
MSTETVFPYTRKGILVRGRLATKAKIASLKADPVEDQGKVVSSDRIFDGWYVPEKYKGYFLHVICDDGYMIHAYKDGQKKIRTPKVVESAEAAEIVCKMIDEALS